MDKDFPIEGKLSDIGIFFITVKTKEGKKITLPSNVFMQKMIRKDDAVWTRLHWTQMIDEMTITTIPVLLGGGVSLFGDLSQRLEFECVESKIYLDRIVQNKFRRKN